MVQACAFSPDGTLIASGSYDGSLKLWDAATGTELATLAEHRCGISSCRFSPDGSRIISIADDDEPRLWMLDGDVIRSRALKGHRRFVRAHAFSPDGRRLVTGGDDKALFLRNAITGKKLAVITIEGAEVTAGISACDFSPDGTRIISASWGGALKLWDGVTGGDLKDIGEHQYPKVCAFSPDGMRVLSGAEGSLRTWNAADGSMQGEFCVGGGIRTAQWSADGSRIVAGTDGGRVLLLQLENQELSVPIVSAWRGRKRGSASLSAHVGCPVCRSWTEITGEELDFLMSCGQCGQRLKVNFHTINGDWRSIAAAWGDAS